MKKSIKISHFIYLIISINFHQSFCESNLNCSLTYNTTNHGSINIFQFPDIIDKVFFTDTLVFFSGNNYTYKYEIKDSKLILKDCYNDLYSSHSLMFVIKLKELNSYLKCDNNLYCDFANQTNFTTKYLFDSYLDRLEDNDPRLGVYKDIKSSCILLSTNNLSFFTVCERDYFDYSQRISSNGIILSLIQYDRDEKLFHFQQNEKDGSRAMTGFQIESSNGNLDLIQTFISKDNLNNFVYGYVLTKEEIKSETITRLGRVCFDDPTFNSHIEIRIACEDNSNPSKIVKFERALNSHFGKADIHLIQQNNVTSDDFLFVTFNEYGHQNEHDPSKDTIICAFSLELLNRFYKEGIQKCHAGEGNDISSTGDKNCVKTNEDNLECSRSEINDNIFYDQKPFYGQFLHKFKDEIITSFISTKFKTQTEQLENKFLFGTDSGKIFELKRKKNNQLKSELKFDLYNSTSRSQIDPRPTLFENKVYFTSGSFVIEYPLMDHV